MKIIGIQTNVMNSIKLLEFKCLIIGKISSSRPAHKRGFFSLNFQETRQKCDLEV